MYISKMEDLFYWQQLDENTNVWLLMFVCFRFVKCSTLIAVMTDSFVYVKLSLVIFSTPMHTEVCVSTRACILFWNLCEIALYLLCFILKSNAIIKERELFPLLSMCFISHQFHQKLSTVLAMNWSCV